MPAGALGDAREVPIADLLRDHRFRVREGLSEATVARYAHAIAGGVEMPPVLVALVGKVPVVVDGWHRIAAHERCGLAHVRARFVTAAESEAQWLAAQANLRHGLPLRQKEVRTAFRAFIRARKHLHPPKRRDAPRELLSYREIAKELGGIVRHTTIRNWMQADFPEIARRMASEAGPAENEAPGPGSAEEHFAKAAQDALQHALTAARGVRDPQRRGAIIATAQAVLRELESGGEWHPPLPDEF